MDGRLKDAIRIVSDGTAQGTRVYNHDGTEIKNITALRIHPFETAGVVRATIEFACPILDITAITDDVKRYALAEAYGKSR